VTEISGQVTLWQNNKIQQEKGSDEEAIAVAVIQFWRDKLAEREP